MRTQVKNNLSWLLGGFAQKYWAILSKLSGSHLGEEIWQLKRRESGIGVTICSLNFHLQISAVVEKSNQCCRKRRLMENKISQWFPKSEGWNDKAAVGLS